MAEAAASKSAFARRVARDPRRARGGRAAGRIRRARARRHVGEVADEPGDRACARWCSGRILISRRRWRSNIGSFRASVADTTSTRACARRSSTRTIGLTGRPAVEAEVDAYFAPLGADELTLGNRVKHVMRQSRDGGSRIIDRSPRAAGRLPAWARRPRLGTALLWWMRTLAWVWVAKGLFNWSIVLGATPTSAISTLPQPLQATIVFFAASICSRRWACGWPRPGAACSGCCARRSKRFRRCSARRRGAWPDRRQCSTSC